MTCRPSRCGAFPGGMVLEAMVVKGRKQMNLNIERIVSLIAACPPIDEQEHIVAFLDCETGKIDALITKVRTHIDRLREYRAALISAAVTGQIDVREAAD